MMARLSDVTTKKNARIFNVQKYSIYDGPGTRTLIFFKGCPLRCQWCSNPEGLERSYQVMCHKDLCLNCGQCVSVCPVSIHSLVETPQGKEHRIDRTIGCVGCRKCELVCPARALNIAGKEVCIPKMLKAAEQDMLFYMTSGGGITLGGGEALVQVDFATDLLKKCKESGIHTAIETCGYVPLESLLKIAPFTDLFLYDLKHIDSAKHKQYTGVPNERILDNLKEILRRGFAVKIRMPILKGINDEDLTIRKSMEFLLPFKTLKNFQGVDILPYHKLGVNKYRQLDMTYPLDGQQVSLTDDDIKRIERIIGDYDLAVKVIRH